MNKFRLMSVFVTLAMIFSFASVSPAIADGGIDPTAPPTSPTISTDKLDYAAGETPTISGSGFVPNESVTLQVLHTNDIPPGGNGHTPWTVITDADGRLTSSWYVDPDDSTDSTFLLTADSESGLHAEFVFADPPAATVTLNSVFTGWYDSTGAHYASNSNYAVGPYSIGYRNFFVFDLSGVSGIVDSAELVIPDTGCYQGSPGTYTLFDVMTPITTLEATNFGATGIHADLGSGSTLGSVTFSFAPTGGITFGLPPVMVPLNTAGVSAMNSAVGSQVALGGDYIAPAGSLLLGCTGSSPVNLILHLVTNQPPTADAGGSYSGNEGLAIALSGATASDPDLDMLTYAWTVNSASCSFDDASALNPDLTCSDNGSYTATLSVDDGVNPTVSNDATVSVSNVAPTLGAISVDVALVPVNTSFNASATFSDPGTLDIHAASWDWGDDTSAGNVTQGAGFGSVDDSHSYSVPGVYTLKLTVTDNDLADSNESVYQYVVVYDPSGGFVTGGGWIDSPAGAYKADETLFGKANFGFVAKYKKGATVPDGNTQFQFKAGDLNFHSTSYEWLVVAGNTAQFKGEGTINGQGSYMFKIWADDDNPDTFRIMIWGDSGVVYDNGSQQSLGGGNIVVHK